MSNIISKKCDNCGVVKVEVNGWWIIYVHNNSGVLELIKHLIDIDLVKHDENDRLFDVCGQQCLIEKVANLVS